MGRSLCELGGGGDKLFFIAPSFFRLRGSLPLPQGVRAGVRGGVWRPQTLQLMKFLSVHFSVAAPGLGFFVFTKTQDPRCRAEFAQLGVAHEFFFALRRRVGLRA